MNIDKMVKLFELSKRGVGGEKDNASVLLERFLKKHNMTLDDLGGFNKQVFIFSCKNKNEEVLLCQVLCVVLEVASAPIAKYRNGRVKCEIELELSKEDYLMIDYLYSIYRRDLAKEMAKMRAKHRKENKALVLAFIHKNNIFVTVKADEKEGKKKTQDCDLLTLFRLVDDIDASDVKKSISNKPLELEKGLGD